MEDKELNLEENVDVKDTVEAKVQGAKSEAKNIQSGAKFRYFCPSCTRIAFYSSEAKNFGTTICQSCHSVISYEPSNYIPLTDSEIEALSKNE